LAGIKVDAAAASATALDTDNPRPGPPRLIDDDALTRIVALPNVASVVPVVATPMAILPPVGTRVSGRDDGPIFDSVVGVDLAHIADVPVSLLDGRLPTLGSTTEVVATLDYLHRMGVDKGDAQSVIGTDLTLGAPRPFSFENGRRVRAR